MEKRNEGKLRNGYTTGTCAAAAAKAAAMCLFSGPGSAEADSVPDDETKTAQRKTPDDAAKTVRLVTPNGTALELKVLDLSCSGQTASCAVRKDSGDDPDVTNGILIYADVSKRKEPGIGIDGGEGVGRVTKPGLDQPVGAAAINSVPRRMIRQELEEVLDAHPEYAGGLSVVIRIPEGRALAEKTFNPRLGIVGGISVIGTTGIVEPMSDRAMLETIRVSIRVRREAGDSVLVMAPGNYGIDYLTQTWQFPEEKIVQISNYVKDAVQIAAEEGAARILLAGHLGKLIKVAGGVPNTHSQYGDRRMEILTELALPFLLPEQREETAGLLAECIAVDEALRILGEKDVAERVLQEVVYRIKQHLEAWGGGRIEAETVVFAGTRETLAGSAGAEAFLSRLKNTCADESGTVLSDCLEHIRPADKEIMKLAQDRMDILAKPPGSLGLLEETAVRLAGITGQVIPEISAARVVVFCADNGVVTEGVSSAPVEVTALQAVNIAAGRSGMSSMAKDAGAGVQVVDLGIVTPYTSPHILDRKIRRGTGNIAMEPAMTREETVRAIETGIAQALQAKEDGMTALGVGEMGIGNTTTAAAVIAALTGRSAEEVTGRGGGLTDKAFEKKKQVIAKALERYRKSLTGTETAPAGGEEILSDPVMTQRTRNTAVDDPEFVLHVLSELGGLDIAGMCGLFLGCARYRIPVAADGVISAAAALAAVRMHPDVRDYLFLSHRSAETGYKAAAEELGLHPFLDLQMRLGEGSGCPLAFAVLKASCAVIRDMATFEEISLDDGYLSEIREKKEYQQ